MYIYVCIYVYICMFIYRLYIYIFIMKTICPPGYHHNGFVATHALRYLMYGYTLLVPIKSAQVSIWLVLIKNLVQ